MRSISSFFLGLCFISVSATAGEVIVTDPMEYSRDYSKEFAKDRNGRHWGWDGCDLATNSTWTRPTILCTGFRTLVVDGDDVETSFYCWLRFESQGGDFHRYSIISQGCQ